VANKVMTVLEARVPSDHWGALETTYGNMGTNRPAQLERAYLLQSTEDSSLWRLVAIWQSRATLQAYQGSVATPGGVLLFRSVGAEPSLSLFDLKGEQGE
jgi:hypothetical protein